MLPFFDDFAFYLRLDSDSRCGTGLPDYFSALEVKWQNSYGPVVVVLFRMSTA